MIFGGFLQFMSTRREHQMDPPQRRSETLRIRRAFAGRDTMTAGQKKS